MSAFPRVISFAGLSLSIVLMGSFVRGQVAEPIVYQDLRHDRSPNLRDMVPAIGAEQSESEQEMAESPGPYRSDNDLRPNAQSLVDPVLQSFASTPSTITAGSSFDGVTHNGWVVADPNVAVGATQVVQWVNTRFAVYNKTTGAKTYGPVNGNTLWNGFGGSCQNKNSGDPIVQYDKAAARWVMMQHATPAGGPYYLCVAVSTTSDATGTFNRYAFQVNNWPDYPKLGIWSDGYYVSYDNLLNGGKTSTSVCALNRANMLTGASATSVCFTLDSKYQHLLPSDLDGATLPPSGAPDYFMNMGTNSLNIWQFHVNFQTTSKSTFTGPTNIPVATFTRACSGGVCIPQSGTSQQLDSLADRLMYRLAYRNFSGHESLVVTHSVGLTSGIRWYEIRSPGSGPFVYQSGTYSPNSNWRWEGSAAMDSAGNMAIAYSVSSSSMHPSIGYAGRLSTDALGTLESETVAYSGAGSETTGNYRWDDYTSLSIDPVDDCTFWYTNEYYPSNGSTSWNTRILSFKFSSCH
jgi:hypothetical protein